MRNRNIAEYQKPCIIYRILSTKDALFVLQFQKLRFQLDYIQKLTFGFLFVSQAATIA